VDFVAIWYILCSVGIGIHGHLVYFSRFGILCKEKSGNPGLRQTERFQRQEDELSNKFNSGSMGLQQCEKR
jgi:hypothetical protein